MANCSVNPSKVQPFTLDVSDIELPPRFTFPYYYEPHPLANIAMDALQEHLTSIEQTLPHLKSVIRSRMYAVLVVKNNNGELGYLCSVRGLTQELTNQVNDLFVEDIGNVGAQQSNTTHANLIELQQKIVFQLKADPLLKLYQQQLIDSNEQSALEISQLQQEVAQRKAQRKQKRAQSDVEQLAFFAKQSSQDKQALKSLKASWKSLISETNQKLNRLNSAIAYEEERLQKITNDAKVGELESYKLLNAFGHEKNLVELFRPHHNAKRIDLSFIRENLPKLLQSAYILNEQPIALGEFWWGDSPRDEIRQHKNLYPVCQSKCYEILEHMLNGLDVDKSPLEVNPAIGKTLSILYQDQDIVVVNKPAEFLSVSGKTIKDSVEQRIKELFPDAKGPLIVHRLDMSTSGLLVLTLTALANKKLQQQFISRTVKKRYTALVEGEIGQDNGTISLPLTGDLLDRPRQMVSHEKGRIATTHFDVVKRKSKQTLIHLYPVTGRTHQLRVHCAHKDGLNSPIVGDDLYGFKNTRLHLHAGYIEFFHPITNDVMTFEIESDF